MSSGVNVDEDPVQARYIIWEASMEQSYIGMRLPDVVYKGRRQGFSAVAKITFILLMLSCAKYIPRSPHMVLSSFV